MRHAALKLGFIHRRLWARDPTYRMASLAGPPPLVGMAAATIAWGCLHMIAAPMQRTATGNLPWARWTPTTPSGNGPPIAALPDEPFPNGMVQGIPPGLTTGWLGRVQPITLGPALGVDVLPTRLASVPLDQPGIDLDRIVAAGPPGGLFVGVANAMLAVRKAGTYGISIRMERTSDQAANCLQRLGFAHRRLVSNLDLGLHGVTRHDYRPLRFDLLPGLYGIAAVTGCWSGRSAVGPGTLTVLIQHPGDPTPRSANADEILHPTPSSR